MNKDEEIEKLRRQVGRLREKLQDYFETWKDSSEPHEGEHKNCFWCDTFQILSDTGDEACMQMNMKHHPSCRPNDKALVWHCNQCGLNECAERLLDRERAKVWDEAEKIWFEEEEHYILGDVFLAKAAALRGKK